MHRLIVGKQAWSEPLDEVALAQGFNGWHQRGYLPHRDVPNLKQFVTFRLRDSFPASRRGEWEALLRIENNRQRREKLEQYLDCGHGECWLKHPAIAVLAENTLRHFVRHFYELLAWAIMPNHIHALFQVWTTPLEVVVKSWKIRIALEANKLLCRQGTFWQREYWDTYMRSAEQLTKAQRYIEQNPVKASLVRQANCWPWSSARFRDGNGNLILAQ